MAGKPRPPAPLRGHACKHGADREHDARAGERRKNQGLRQHCVRVAGLQCIEDRAVPDVDALLHEHLKADESEQRKCQQPSGACAARTPKTRGGRPEPAHQEASGFPLTFQL